MILPDPGGFQPAVNFLCKIRKKVLTQRRGVWYYNKAVRDGGAVLGRARTLKIEQHLVLERTEALEIF